MESSRYRALLLLLSLLSAIALVGNSAVHARERPHHEITASAGDLALREALMSGDLEEFEQLLELGASPTEWLDDSGWGWVFCAATETGREEFLRLLIDRGFDVNFRQVDISTSISLPLTCAVSHGNLSAVKILVNAGADPTASPSLKFPDRIPMSVMSRAIMVGKYNLAAWLFDKGNYTDEQLRSDIGMLEKFPVSESAPGNIDRLLLADMFREKGYEVTPWTRKKTTDK